MKRLEGKVAVIYSNGVIGSAIAKAFSREGANVFLAGRTKQKLEEVSKEILSSGGKIDVAEVDALNDQVVEQHLQGVFEKAGKVDISFNAIGIPQKGIQGLPIADLSLEQFANPIKIYTQSHFITAKAAIKLMQKQEHGVLLAQIPNASHKSPPFVGGMIPAWSAIEALYRSISSEYGQCGIRSVCLLTTGIPETPLIHEVWEIHGKSHGITYEQFHEIMESQTHRKKLTTLDELLNASIFVASDEGSAITGTFFNLTAGMVV